MSPSFRRFSTSATRAASSRVDCLGHLIESQPLRGQAATLLSELREQSLQLHQRSELAEIAATPLGSLQCAPGTFELRARRSLLRVESLAPIGQRGQLGRHGNVGEERPIDIVGWRRID